MPEYITPYDDPIDADALVAEAYDILGDALPDYVPDDNSLENWLLLCLARIAATNANVGRQMPLAAFRWYGQTVIGLQPQGGAKASAYATVTAVDSQGYTLPAGSTVGYQVAGDELVPFITVNDVTIPPGSTASSSGEVVLEALQVGTASNGLGPSGLTMVDALAWVDSITATAATAGGVNAETDEEYIARLITELRLLTPTPILPWEFGAITRNVTGVARAVGVDGYDPGTGTYDHDRTVAVAAVDGSGEGVGTPVKNAVKAYLESLREVGFVVNVFDPTYTTVDVDFTFTPYKDADPGAVQSVAISAITAYLHPARWGVEEDDTVGITWVESPTLHRSEIMGILMRVPGLRWVNSLTVNSSTNEEIALAGPAALTRPGAITGAVAS